MHSKHLAFRHAAAEAKQYCHAAEACSGKHKYSGLLQNGQAKELLDNASVKEVNDSPLAVQARPVAKEGQVFSVGHVEAAALPELHASASMPSHSALIPALAQGS